MAVLPVNAETPWRRFALEIRSASGWKIATVAQKGFTVEERRTNGDLLAAAPDLLTACNTLTEMCRRLGFDTPSMPGFERTAYEQGLAAIAKATGTEEVA